MKNGLLGLLFLLSIASFAQKKIIVLGSSTSLGAAATSYDSSFAGRLQAFYRKNTSAGNPDTVVTPVGGYGYTTYKALPNGYVPAVQRHAIDPTTNVNAVLAMNPDVVIINFPGNDVATYAQPWITPAYSTKETMDNFRVMYNFFAASGVKCYVSTTQPRNDLDISQRQLQRNLVDSINNNFGQFAINFWDDLVVPGGSNLLKDEVRHLGFADQDYHLNNTGHRYLFERIKSKNIFQAGTPLPAPPDYISIPAKIEAENYSVMNGVQNETTMDAGGGLNVGYIDNGDWMEYNISPASTRTYSVALRVAAMDAGGQLQIKKPDGTVLATVSIPQTGGWQVWQTVNTTISLSAGNQAIRIVSSSATGWNINWIDISLVVVPPPPPINYVTIPGKIEAENYFAMSGVQTEATADAGGGMNVGYIDLGDWMDFNIAPASTGTYSVALRLAALNSGGQLQIRKSDGTVLATVSIPSTSGWQNWQTVNTTISLSVGNQTLRIVSTAAPNWNLNWLDFTLNAGPPPPPPPPAYVAIPAKIEAEAYIAQSGTQTEPTSDVGGGNNIGYIDNGDWMEYNVASITGGNFIFRARVASIMTGGQLQIKNSSGTILATLNIPNTGSWQTWATIEIPVTLPAGNQTLRVVSSSVANWNINWIEFVQNTPPPPSTKRIEAENYVAMSGVQTEVTLDTSGVLNVTGIDRFDWMEYTYTAPSAGPYEVSFRIAAPFVGELVLLKPDGTSLGAMTVHPTGGFQIWRTYTGTFTLAAGIQTLRLVSTGSGKWNINWLEFKPASTVTARTFDVKEQVSETSSVQVFPNPFTEQLTIKLNSEYSGQVKAEIFDMSGKVQRTFVFEKISKGISSFYLSLSSLAKGQYILKLSNKNRGQSIPIQKQ